MLGLQVESIDENISLVKDSN